MFGGSDPAATLMKAGFEEGREFERFYRRESAGKLTGTVAADEEPMSQRLQPRKKEMRKKSAREQEKEEREKGIRTLEDHVKDKRAGCAVCGCKCQPPLSKFAEFCSKTVIEVAEDRMKVAQLKALEPKLCDDVLGKDHGIGAFLTSGVAGGSEELGENSSAGGSMSTTGGSSSSSSSSSSPPTERISARPFLDAKALKAIAKAKQAEIATRKDMLQRKLDKWLGVVLPELTETLWPLILQAAESGETHYAWRRGWDEEALQKLRQMRAEEREYQKRAGDPAAAAGESATPTPAEGQPDGWARRELLGNGAADRERVTGNATPAGGNDAENIEPLDFEQRIHGHFDELHRILENVGNGLQANGHLVAEDDNPNAAAAANDEDDLADARVALHTAVQQWLEVRGYWCAPYDDTWRSLSIIWR